MENNENQNFPQENRNNGSQIPMQVQLPNSTAVLVLGIVSIVACFCYGLPGLILGIIALVLASKAKQLYNQNPHMYLESSFKNVQTGRICAIIGLVLAVLSIIFMIIYFLILGFAMSDMNWQNMLDQI